MVFSPRNLRFPFVFMILRIVGLIIVASTCAYGSRLGSPLWRQARRQVRVLALSIVCSCGWDALLDGTKWQFWEPLDGFMLSFRSVGRGLACAVAIQQDLTVYNKESPDPPLQVRMGLSVGEPVQDKEDLFGVSVITAARISAKADGGQVLLSQVAYALASSSGEFEFRTIGEFELKGLGGRHEIYELLWRGE